MAISRVIAVLLRQACPSIQYRLRREILGQRQDSPEMLALQEQILADPAVKEVLGWQQPDGWLAWNFHGSRSCEAGIRYLCEKGVDPAQPALARALRSLESETSRLERGIGQPGRILDALGMGGSLMIRAAVLAQAGIEDIPCVQEQVGQALDGFEAILAIETTADLVETYRGRLVFRQGIAWPSIYHLRLLAWTQGWRTPENQALVAESVRRLVRLSPIPALNVRFKSRLVTPASFCMDDFHPDLATLEGAHWMMWLHRMELLARLGVVGCIPELEGQAAALRKILASGCGQFTIKLEHPYFRKWGAYTGLALEKDWKDPQRRQNDLTFRSLLILDHLCSI